MSECLPKISVIVPVFNTKKYLERCIESVQKQTYTDYELILVDDGSSDNAGEICDSYANSDGRIIAIHQENSGLAMARKKGLEHASGEFVMFVDSDDWIDNAMLEEMYKYVRKFKADMVCCQFKRVDEVGHIQNVCEKHDMILCDTTESMVYHAHVTRLLNLAAWTKLIKTSLVKQITFSKNLAIGEEHDMITQLLLIAKKLVIISNAYYNYFVRSNSISRSGYCPKYANSLEKYIDIEETLEEKFSQYKTPLRAFYAEYEMAVIAAMCRNQVFDWEVINSLRNTLKKNFREIRKNKGTAHYLKICSFLIIFFPRLFIAAFTLIHKLTGR